MAAAPELNEQEDLMQEIREEIEKMLLTQNLSDEEKSFILTTALRTVENMGGR